MDISRTTNEMDKITAEERNALVAYCETDEQWWKFIQDNNEAICPRCGDAPSKQVGFQIITQRTYNPLLHGKKKIKKR